MKFKSFVKLFVISIVIIYIGALMYIHRENYINNRPEFMIVGAIIENRGVKIINSDFQNYLVISKGGQKKIFLCDDYAYNNLQNGLVVDFKYHVNEYDYSCIDKIIVINNDKFNPVKITN